MAGSGLHLLIDGRTHKLLEDRELISFIRACASRDEGIDMKIITGPIAVETPGFQEAFAIIAESHIMVRASQDGVLLIDVFSCREFDTMVPVRLAERRLGLEGFRTRTIRRAGARVYGNIRS